MIHSLIHPRGLIHKRGLQNPFLASPSGPNVLANLLFGEPVVAYDFTSQYATDEWTLQEPSGSYANNVGSETLSNSGGLQGQTAVGIRTASSFTARKAWEVLNTTDVLTASGTAAGDSDSDDLAVRVSVRCKSTPSTDIQIIGNYVSGSGAGNGGWMLYASASALYLWLYDGTTVKSVPITPTIYSGDTHMISAWYDQSAQMAYIKIDDGAPQSVSTAGLGSVTNSRALTVGKGWKNALSGMQMVSASVCVGVNSEAMYDAAEADWQHATDPTPGQLLTTQTRGSAISCPVADGYVAHYADDTIPTAWHAGFSDTDKLGILTNSALTNLLLWSEDFTNAVWTKTTMTVTANNIDSPDGFRSADKLTAGAANDYIAQTFTTVAATQYTLSYWPREETVGATGRLIFYDETGSVELASQVFTCDGTWEQRIDVTATTNGGQISSSFRVEIDTSGESINAWGAQVTLGDGACAYIRTTSTTATLAASDYRAGSLSPATNAAKGEVRAKFIRTQFTTGSSGRMYTVYGTGDQNRRYAFCNTLALMQWRTYDGAGVSEDYQAFNISALNTLQDARHIWDESTGGDITGGYESVMVLNGTAYNGAASPWDGTTGAGADTTVIDIGHTVGGQQMDAIFQSIISYDDLSEPLP